MKEPNLEELVQKEIQSTQDVIERLTHLNVSSTEQKRIQKLSKRFLQLVKEYEGKKEGTSD